MAFEALTAVAAEYDVLNELVKSGTSASAASVRLPMAVHAAGELERVAVKTSCHYGTKYCDVLVCALDPS